MKIVHRLTAYDRATDDLIKEIELSDEHFKKVSGVTSIPAAFHTKFGSLALDGTALLAIAKSLTHLELHRGNLDWFLEASAAERQDRRKARSLSVT